MVIMIRLNNEVMLTLSYTSYLVLLQNHHPSRYLAVTAREAPDSPARPLPSPGPMDGFVQKTEKYTKTHPKQVSMIAALLHTITIGLLPLSLVTLFSKHLCLPSATGTRLGVESSKRLGGEGSDMSSA